MGENKRKQFLLLTAGSLILDRANGTLGPPINTMLGFESNKQSHIGYTWGQSWIYKDLGNSTQKASFLGWCPKSNTLEEREVYLVVPSSRLLNLYFQDLVIEIFYILDVLLVYLKSWCFLRQNQEYCNRSHHITMQRYVYIATDSNNIVISRH